MNPTLESELAALRDRLGPSPLSEVLLGLHHVRYLVRPDAGSALARDISSKTSYRLEGGWRRGRTGAILRLMRREGDPVGIMIEEAASPLSGSPRICGLGFRVSGAEVVRRFLRELSLPFAEEDGRIVAGPVPGLGDRFSFVEAEGFDWLDREPFERAPSEPDERVPAQPILSRVGGIDHIAYRTRLDDVREAATWLSRLTVHAFSECYTIGEEKAETMVFRHGNLKPAIVVSYGWESGSVVAGYVAKHGPRVHHVAYDTRGMREVVDFQRGRGISFTTESVIGSEQRGILQIFTVPSPHSDEITEYIERFGGYTGFFDRGNVGELMDSTRRFNEPGEPG